MKRWTLVGAQSLVLLMSTLAHAGGLGVAGDGFVTTFVNWIPTMLFVAGLVGIAVWYQSSSDYNQGLLSGASSVVSRTLIAGGAIAILAAMGLSQGALLQ